MGTRRPFSAKNKGRIEGFGTQVSMDISDVLLKNARHSGQLNLSNRDLEEIPEKILRINLDVPEEAKDVSLDFDGERWWEQVDLKKLILASNKLTTIPAEICNFPALTVLDIHYNKIDSLPDEIGELQELTRLNASHNNLQGLPKTFGNLKCLQTLLLNDNKLSSLPESFGILENIDELDLSHNELNELPRTFGGLKKLRKLNISSNLLETLPQEVGSLSELKDLNVSNNSLNRLPHGLDGLISLEILDCKFNKLPSFPVFEKEMVLKELYLGNNKLTELNTDSFKSLVSLVILELRDNRITLMPSTISYLGKLERLDVSNNNISALPFEMGVMPLKALVLDGNPLRSLRRDIVNKGTHAILEYLKMRMPAEKEEPSPSPTSAQGEIFNRQESLNEPQVILPTKSLQHSNKQASTIPDAVWSSGVDVNCVDFSRNLLTEFPPRILEFSSTLVELNLSGNKITRMPDTIGLLKRLTDVDFSNNGITELPHGCQNWKHLITINLSANRFTRIPEPLFEISDVCNILINHNQIDFINVHGLLRLKKLQALDLTNNNISQVPPELGNVTWLRSLGLVGNPFRNPRPAVLDKGTQHVLSYLRDRIPT